MPSLEIQQYVVGPVATNCYFLVNKKTDEIIIVDPGAAGEALIQQVEMQQLQPVAILLTHGHFDHAGAAKQLGTHFQIPVYAAEAERETLENPVINLSGAMGGRAEKYQADQFLRDGEEIQLAGFEIRMLLTPGHTPGGCCYYFPKEQVLFSGDTLFAGSVGRTDFPGGSMSELVQAVKEKLMVLPDAVKVYPGHNDLTSIEQERYYNPYI